MKAFIGLLLLLTNSTFVYAQPQIHREAGSVAGKYNSFTSIDPPSMYANRQAFQKTATAQFLVKFDSNFPDSAKKPITEAANIWSFLLTSYHKIHVHAIYDSIRSVPGNTVDTSVLASTSNVLLSGSELINQFHIGGANFDSALVYPIALAEAMSGIDLNLSDGLGPDTIFEMTIEFNSCFRSRWYCGIDGKTPKDFFDLETIALHEIAHGLGYETSFLVDSGKGKYTNSGLPMAYDSHCWNLSPFSSGQIISLYSVNTPQLAAALQSPQMVGFDGFNSSAVNAQLRPLLFSPSTWLPGSSITHLDSANVSDSNPNSLMRYFTPKAYAAHSPGPIGLSILEDLGWSVARLITFSKPRADTVFHAGEQIEMAWSDTKFSGPITLELWKDDGSVSPYHTIGTTSSNQGSANIATYTLPSTIAANDTGTYFIKVSTGVGDFGVSNRFRLSNNPLTHKVVFSRPPGTYHLPLSVSLSDSTPNSDIWYTESSNGDPAPNTSGSIRYDSLHPLSIAIGQSKNFRARAFASGHDPSVVESAQYTVTDMTPNGPWIGQFVGGEPAAQFEWYDPSQSWEPYDAGRYDLSEFFNRTITIRASQRLEMKNEPFPGEENVKYKYHHWTVNSDAGANVYIVNHATIPIDYTVGLITASAFAPQPAVFLVKTIEGITGGLDNNVLFKDPWLIDDHSDSIGARNRDTNALFYPIPSGYGPNLSGEGPGSAFEGVFRAQGDLVNGLKPPYYTVKAPLTQSLSGKSASFVLWNSNAARFANSSALETPVVFNTALDTLYAIYKSHLIGSTNLALSGNAQSKLVVDNQGTSFLAYESGGTPFITSSTNKGLNWSNEGLLSTGLSSATSNYSSPSLCVSPSGIGYDAVWDCATLTGTSWSHRIQAMLGGNLTTAVMPSEGAASPLCPVIISDSSFGGMRVVAWQDSLSIGVSVFDSINANWKNPEVFTGIGNLSHPSLTISSVYGQSTKIFLAYDDDGVSGGGIVCHRGFITSSMEISWDETPVLIASNSTTNGMNRNPVIISVPGNLLQMAWEWVGPNSDSIRWASLSSDNLSVNARKSFHIGSAGSHNLGFALRCESDISILLWQVDGLGIAGAQFAAGTWSVPTIVKPGAVGKPVLAQRSKMLDQSFLDRKMAFLMPSGSLYSVAVEDHPSVANITRPVQNGWNMMSAPVIYKGTVTRQAVYPTSSASAPIYGYSGGYYPVDYWTNPNGHGYWVQYGSNQSVGFYGSYLANVNISLDKGWNMVGSISRPSEVNGLIFSPDTLNRSDFYTYINGGYSVTDTITPAYGYWVKASSAGSMAFDTSGYNGTNTRSAFETERLPSSGNSAGGTVATPVLRQPVNGISSQPATVLFYWTRGEGSGKYHFELSTNSGFATFTLNQFVDKETLSVANLASATYYWRVADSTTGVGTSNWSTVSTLTCGPPNAPALYVPDEGAQNQQLTTALSWSAVAGALRYQVQVSDAAGFTPLIFNDSTLGMAYAVVSNLYAGTEFYWRVRASNGSWWSTWSTVRHFNTGAAPYDPVPQSPANGATNQLATLSIRWWHSDGAESYHLQLAPTSNFTSPLVNDTLLTDTVRVVSNLTNFAIYYWRVRARNIYGLGQWSAVSSFTVGVPPPAPTLSTPTAGTTGISVTPTLAWNGISGATGYRLQLAKQQNFNTINLDYQNLSATSKQTDYLDGSTQYFWRVNATNQAGTSTWSEVRNFTTGATPPPATPVLAAPSNNATGIGLSGPTLTWSASTNATDYRLQVSTSSNFTSGTIVNSYLAALTYADWDPLIAQTTYYWHVLARNAAGSSAWSPTWQFTTVAGGGGCGGAMQATLASPGEMDALTVTDAKGRSQTLYVFNGMDKLAPRMDHFNEMPPEPLPGTFSARFINGHFFESLHPDKGRKTLPLITVKGAEYPLTFSWNLKTHNNMTYWMPHPDNPRRVILLQKHGSVGMSGQGKKTLAVDVQAMSTCGLPPVEKAVPVVPASDMGGKPKEFALMQNMPNPFNPTTVINYELPVDARVDLRVYNILGQEIATLVEATQQGGYHSVNFNASNVSSGVYFYRFKATPLIKGEAGKEYVRILKMVLLK